MILYGKGRYSTEAKRLYWHQKKDWISFDWLRRNATHMRIISRWIQSLAGVVLSSFEDEDAGSLSFHSLQGNWKELTLCSIFHRHLFAPSHKPTQENSFREVLCWQG